MMEKDAVQVCGSRHLRAETRRGYRWGRTRGKIGFHAGKIDVERPRVRDFAGRELVLPSWERAMGEDWLGKWAMNLMLLNVSTRKFRRAVRLPEGDVPASAGSGVSKGRLPGTSWHCRGRACGNGWRRTFPTSTAGGADRRHPHQRASGSRGCDRDRCAGHQASTGIDRRRNREHCRAQALIDDLIERGLDPAVPLLFIIDGSKALSRAIRRSFGRTRRSSAAKSTKPATSWSGAEAAACFGPPCTASSLGA